MKAETWLLVLISAAAALPAQAAPPADSARTDSAFQAQLGTGRIILDQARQLKESHEAQPNLLRTASEAAKGPWRMLGYGIRGGKCGKLSPVLHSVLLADADRLIGITRRGEAVLEFDSLQKAQAARGRRDSCAEIGQDIWPVLE